MKFIRTIALAALTVGASASHGAALGSIDLSSGSNGFFTTPIAGSFVDTLTFTLTTASFLTGSVTSVVSGNQDVDFTSIIVSGPAGNFGFTMVLPDPVEVWALPGSGAMLTAGNYILTLTGTNSVGIGSYAGNLAVTAVPEPETLALMLAGIGAVGFIARRRKS